MADGNITVTSSKEYAMNSQQTRTIFTDFYREREHQLILGFDFDPAGG